MTENIKFLRLYTGEDLVSEVVEIEDKDSLHYLLINPQRATYIESGSGMIRIAFTPWVYPKIAEKNEFEIDASYVMTTCNVSTDMLSYYHEHLANLDKPEDPLDDMPEEALQELLNNLQGKITYH